MGIQGVMKIGIATKDLDETANVLGDAFGLVPGEAVAYPPLGMRYRILKVGDFFIEVIEPMGSDGPIAKFIERTHINPLTIGTYNPVNGLYRFI